jgi:hypothetical protein
MGVAPRLPHVLRHSFISALASEGVDQRVIDETVGHQSEEQRKRYRHLYPKVMRDAISRVFGQAAPPETSRERTTSVNQTWHPARRASVRVRAERVDLWSYPARGPCTGLCHRRRASALGCGRPVPRRRMLR